MKILDGAQLAEYIKERQAKQVRALRQAHNIFPRLAIVVTNDDPVSNTYIRLKEQYGQDIQVEVDIHRIKQATIHEVLTTLNSDTSIHGIIVQLPLENMEGVDEVLNTIAPTKDVDGLGKDAQFDPATPTAINWLLAGYNVDLKNKKICIVGQGRLVGGPLYTMWQAAEYDVQVITEKDNLGDALSRADVIVTATGQPGLIKSDIVPIGAVVVDAGMATYDGKVVGDVEEAVYQRDDVTLTPKKGGVGPLTIAVLFENVIRAARP